MSTIVPSDDSEEVERIVDILFDLNPRLRALGHAHVHLDANARYLIARAIVEGNSRRYG